MTAVTFNSGAPALRFVRSTSSQRKPADGTAGGGRFGPAGADASDLALTAAKGNISRIVARLDGPVTTPRIDTHYTVTEFGAANLEGLSSTERELKLIELAYPEFRDHLTEAAKQLHLI